MRVFVAWALAAALLTPGVVQAQDVMTESGPVRGAARNDVVSWKGIPFAAPPVGALRWRAPQKPASWTQVRPATRFRNDCMQLPFFGDAAPLAVSPAEDCLYLNIWRPQTASAPLPVVV